MRIRGFLLILVVLAQAVLLSTESKADVANPIVIVNGKSMIFTANIINNWYSFTLTGNSNLLFSGSDSNGSDIADVNIYDENLAEVVDDYWVTVESYSLLIRP